MVDHGYTLLPLIVVVVGCGDTNVQSLSYYNYERLSNDKKRKKRRKIKFVIEIL